MAFSANLRLKGGNPQTRREVLAERYLEDVILDVDFYGYVYQYQFTKAQFLEGMEMVGFEIDCCFSFNGEAGLIFSFGNLAGRYDRVSHESRLTLPAEVLYRILGDDALGHMICCVARKPGSGVVI